MIDIILFLVMTVMRSKFTFRSHLIFKILGEKEQDTSRRYVDIEAKELEVVLDKNSISRFLNQGEASLTAQLIT